MKQRLTRVLLAIAVVCSLLVFVPQTANAAAPTSQGGMGSVLLSTTGPATFSHLDGSGSVGGCNSSQVTTYGALSPIKPVNLVVVPGLSYCSEFANGAAVTDKNGSLYLPAASTTPGDFNARLLAFNRDGTLRWNIDPPSSSVIKNTLGINGNLYGISTSTNGREQHLFSYSGLSSTAPTLTLDKTLVSSGERNAVSLAAYSSGVAVQYDNAQVEYIGLDGIAKGLINATNAWYSGNFNIGLDGQIFLPISSGKQNSFCAPQGPSIVDSISVYGPSGMLWSTKLAACATVAAIWPAPDGGAVLLTESNDFVAKKRSLLSLKPGGAQRWQNEVPFGNGSATYASPQISVTTAGDVALATNYTRSDNNPGVAFSLLSGQDGQVLFANDIAPSQSDAASYKLSGNTYSMAVTSGRAYLAINSCQYSTNGGRPDCFGNASLYTIVDPKLAIDYPRGPIMQGTATNLRKYYALGDSFASGEGVSPFIDGTDIGEDTCHRSTLAYAKLLEQNTSLNVQIPDKGFVACSGAETKNISNEGRSDEDPQINALDNGDANIVTLSIGGNDVMFSDFVKTCMFLNCSTTKNAQDFFAAVNGLGNKLKDVYTQVLQKAPNAKVYVVGYPQLLPEKGCSKTDGWMETFDTLARQAQRGVPAAVAAITEIGKSSKLTDAQIKQLIRSGKVEFNQNEVKTARNLVSTLDAKIKATVKAVNNNRLVYVDPLVKNSPFIGHELCTDKQYFNGVVINPAMAKSGYDIEYSFHPNQLGQSEGYYRLLLPYFSK